MLERVVGQEGDEFQAVYNQSIGWAERQYASAQLMGSHFINEDGSIFGEWQVTASQAYMYAPDRRDFTFTASSNATNPEDLKSGFDFGRANDDQSVAMQGFFLEPGVITRRYDELTDNNFDASFDITWDVFDSGSSFSSMKLGRKRSFATGTRIAKPTDSTLINHSKAFCRQKMYLSLTWSTSVVQARVQPLAKTPVIRMARVNPLRVE